MIVSNPAISRLSRTAWSPSSALTALRVGSALVLACLLAIGGWQLTAQVEGDRGIAAVARSSDIMTGGIEVDVRGSSYEDARMKGWKLAQRRAWSKLGGPSISDGQLDSMVSAIIIEKENIAPRRYVATLGVVFDRQRAGGALGARGGAKARSAPMLTIPVLFEGGARTVYERRNPWQRVWAEYQAGSSAIDYVRPSGAGGDSLLVTYGQTQRRSRSWWRNILDQFEAADVLVPIAHLERQWPGGPVQGRFTARYGPDGNYLESFELTADTEADVPAMLQAARERFNGIFTQALEDGKLRPDPTLRSERGAILPVFQALIDAGRRAQAAERAAEEGGDPDSATAPDTGSTPTPTPTVAAPSSIVVQFSTPDAASFDSALSSVRTVPGVRGAAASSTAIGGTSVMRVTYQGDLSALAAALRARGWQVNQGANALAISR